MKKLICCLATFAVAFGALSAVTFVKANAETTPAFKGVSVSLNENIVLKFGIENYTEGYTLTFNYKNKDYVGEVKGGVAEFAYVTPQYLGETVTATIYNGETKVTETKKSVKEYLYELIHAKKADYSKMPCEQFAAMKTLAVDMLNYGAAAQAKYLEKDSYTLVNADLTTEEAALATTFAAPGENAQATLSGEKTGYEWVSAGIRFDYNVSLYFVVKPLTENAVLKLKINDNEVIDKFTKDENGNYKFRYENVNVVDFANKYTVKVLDEENKEIGQTLSYSVNTYVLNMHANAETGEITKAVYNYGVSATKYNAAKGEHVYTKLEFAEEQRVVAGEDVLAENLKVNKVCSVCGHSEETTAATYDTTKTFTLEDNTVEVTADGIVAEAEVTVLTRLATPEADTIKLQGWVIEFDRQATFPESYGTVSGKTGFLRYDFVERIEYTFYKEKGVDLGTLYLVKKGSIAYLTLSDGTYATKLDGTVGDLYAMNNSELFFNVDTELSRLCYLAMGENYVANTQYYIKAKVIAKENTLYVDSKESTFDNAKTFTVLGDWKNVAYTAPDANMFMVNTYEWDKGASAFEANRYSDSNDTRLSNVNVAYIKITVYDTYTGSDLGSFKIVRLGKLDAYLSTMNNEEKYRQRLDCNPEKPAFSDFCLVVTKKTEEGGGLSDKGLVFKNIVDEAIKNNIPSDGYYSLGFKGQVIAYAGSGYEDSAIYDYGKVNVLSDLMSNYKLEA